MLPTRPSSEDTRAIRSRLERAEVPISVCPYCAVGCSQLVYHRDGTVLSFEGNYESFINGGTLCPKGAATYGLVVHPRRVTCVEYRRPYGEQWEEISLDWAMERIAQLVKQPPDGTTVNRISGIAHHEGATLDDEENYGHQEALHRRPGDGLPREPGPDLTQRHGARSGRPTRPRRGDDH